ncbi:hypothetical protein RRF57_012959 [Xylaria bambusicola]|uniref:Carboxylic ester hydrolase n=1 Tax=Xylaria bambusicola TaxID=326684 RepID=A0AAN7ZBC5_9PEZI
MAASNLVDCVAQTAKAHFNGHIGVPESVCEWLGIPYAAPPTGQLRFSLPKKFYLEGSINADNYGFDCPQTPSDSFVYPNATSQYLKIYADFVNQLNNTQSEDCLTLNVWSRTSKSGHILKPVIVWVHGGRFATGSSHTPFYHGGNLAGAQDVVVVTFNFRMNIFGFPGSPETAHNIGFFDQYLAVEWVYDNIKAFGGDPERITLIGQSSGAVAVSNWAYAFKDNPIVTGTISHSGSIFSFPILNADLAAANWNHVVSALGCGISDSALSCMRSENVSFRSILSAVKTVPQTGNSPTRSVPPFQATVDNITLFSVFEYVSRLKSSKFAPLPHFQIHGDHESGFYRISALAQGRPIPESEWVRFELESFTCATAAETYWRSRAGVPTYRARYMADWENLRLYYPPSSGAYHGVEVSMVTGNSRSISGITPSPYEAKLVDIMQNAWAGFAADPVQGLLKLGWPRYQASSESLIRLGVDTTPVVDAVSSAMYDNACSALNLSFWDVSIPPQ